MIPLGLTLGRFVNAVRILSKLSSMYPLQGCRLSTTRICLPHWPLIYKALGTSLSQPRLSPCYSVSSLSRPAGQLSLSHRDTKLRHSSMCFKRFVSSHLVSQRFLIVTQYLDNSSNMDPHRLNVLFALTSLAHTSDKLPSSYSIHVEAIKRPLTYGNALISHGMYQGAKVVLKQIGGAHRPGHTVQQRQSRAKVGASFSSCLGSCRLS
jgi:hypothetical protein